MSQPRVSVIIIFFNEGDFLAEAIESVLAQDFQDFELILVDDGSSDASTATARDYAGNEPHRIVYLEHSGHTNRGSSAARNLGLSKARGEFVTWLDGDDVIRRTKLAEQVDLLDAHPDVGMVCGGYNRWRSWRDGRDAELLSGPRSDRPIFPPETTLEVYPLGWSKNPTETMIRREIALETGGFEEDFPGLYDDQTFYSKAFLLTGVLFSERVWLDYRAHDASCTAHVDWGEYAATRLRFLDWLERYVSAGSYPSKDRILARIGSERRQTNNRLAFRVRRKARWALLSSLRWCGFSARYKRDRVTG